METQIYSNWAGTRAAALVARVLTSERSDYLFTRHHEAHAASALAAMQIAKLVNLPLRSISHPPGFRTRTWSQPAAARHVGSLRAAR